MIFETIKPKNYPNPGISKMWSAFFMLSILPEILRISFEFYFLRVNPKLSKSEQIPHISGNIESTT